MASPSQGSPQSSAQAVQMGNIIQAESRRRLAPVAYSSGQLGTLDLPRDTVIKRMEVSLTGSFIMTYGSGSPLFQDDWMSKLCNRMDVVIDGQRTVKSLDFEMQRYLNNIYSGNYPRRRYGTGAALTTLQGTTEWLYGTVAYPATTEYFWIDEAVTVHFEMPLSYAYDQRMATLLNIKDVSSANVRFSFADISNLLQFGNAATPVASAVNLNFICTLIENRAVPREQQFYDFKETVKRVSYSAQVSGSQIELNRGNALAGVHMMVKNGNANKTLSDVALTDIALLVNGQQIIQSTKFKELQTSNQGRFGVNDLIASSSHVAQGHAFMNLIQSGRIDSALNTTLGAGIDQVVLQVSTAASTGVDAATYTNGVEVSLLQMEIAAVPLKA